jgi:hypothetical protein
VVAAKIALAIAGATVGTAVSPNPPRAGDPWRKCVVLLLKADAENTLEYPGRVEAMDRTG